MKKLLVGFAAALGLSSVALAADPLPNSRAQFGVSLGFAGAFAPGAFIKFDANKLATLAQNVNLGLRTRLDLDFIGGFSVGAFAAPVATFGIENGAVYVGPSIGVATGTGGAVAFGVGIAGGGEFAITEPLNVFVDVNLGIVPSFVGSFSAGAEYQISPPLGIVGAATVGFGGGVTVFGVDLGVAYRF